MRHLDVFSGIERGLAAAGLLLLLWVAATRSAAGQELGTSGEPAPPSIRVEIEDWTEKFVELAEDRAVQAWNAINQQGPEYEDARRAAAAFQAKPNDPQVRAAYQAAFARALTEFSRRSDEFLATREPVEAAYEQFERSCQTGIQHYAREERDHRRQAVEHRRKAREHLGWLHELKARFPEADAADLPAEVSQAVLVLDQRMHNAQNHERLARSRAETVLENRRDLEVSLDAAREIRDALDLRYLVAANDGELIQSIAEHELNELEGGRLAEHRKRLESARSGIKPIGQSELLAGGLQRLGDRRQGLQRSGGPSRPSGEAQQATGILGSLPELEEEDDDEEALLTIDFAEGDDQQ